MALVGTSPSSYPRILGTAFSPLSPLPVVRCTFLSPRSLSLSHLKEDRRKISRMPRVRVCVNVRVCAFFPPLRSFLDAGNLLPKMAGCTLERKTACLLPSLPLSLFVAYKEKKSGQAFIYCFACFLIAILQLPFKVEMQTFFQHFLTPECSHLFFGQVVLLCKESDCWPSFMMHSGR